MALYYKTKNPEEFEPPLSDSIQVHTPDSLANKQAAYDFSCHVLVELLDAKTSERKLWSELGLQKNEGILYKRMMSDPHRVNCRRAIVVCETANKAMSLAETLSQQKIGRRCICAVVMADLLSDLKLFEKQIEMCGDMRTQSQLVFVTDLNRCREPTGLVQFLQELFSPFGEIQSIMVSQDNEGYAHPEGVVRFSHLSEAFAAEIALDQFVVGKERLSVTTHHNIMLAECDLRARLREGQLSNNTFSDSSLCAYSCFAPKRHSPIENSILDHTEQQVSENVYPTDSVELADVMANPMQPSLIHCLDGVKMCPESSQESEYEYASSISSLQSSQNKENISKKRDKSINSQGSAANITKVPVPKSAINNSQITNGNGKSSNADNTLSSRILSWINNVPDDNYNSKSDGSPSKARSPQKFDDITSVSSSYVTCEEGGISLPDPLSSPLDILRNSNFSNEHNNTVLLAEDLASVSDDFENDSQCSSKMSLQKKTIGKTSNASLSQKLSLKSHSLKSEPTICLPSTLKRKRSMENISKQSKRNPKLTTELDIAFDSSGSLSASTPNKNNQNLMDTFDSFDDNGFNDKIEEGNDQESTSDVSDCDPAMFFLDFPKKKCEESRENKTNLDRSLVDLSIWREPSVCSLENDVSKSKHSISPVCLVSSKRTPKNSISPHRDSNATKSKYSPSPKNSNSSKHESKNDHSVSQSSTRRSSRLTSMQKSTFTDQKTLQSNTSRNSSIVSNKSNKSFPFVNATTNEKNSSESPLRDWLKKEIEMSTNNRVTRNSKGPRSIVCATMKKDVLISVGCSHMTCDHCYPDSMKLLLGTQ